MELSVHPCVSLASSTPNNPLRDKLTMEETVVLGMVEDALRMRLDTAAAVTMNLEAVMIICRFSNSKVTTSHFRINGFRVRYLNCVEV